MLMINFCIVKVIGNIFFFFVNNYDLLLLYIYDVKFILCCKNYFSAFLMSLLTRVQL